MTSLDDGLTRLLHKLRDGVAVLDADRRVVDANDALTSMLGYSVSELREQPSFLALAAPRDDAGTNDRVYELARVARRFEVALLHKGGRRVEVEVTVSDLDDGLLLAIVRDVTARKRAESALLHVSDALEQSIREHADELARANSALGEAIRVRDEFIQIASHELRTPLTPLLLQLQMLRKAASAEPQPEQPRMASALDATLRHVKRMSRLVDQLLDVSVRPSAEIPLEIGALDLMAVVREVLMRAETEAISAGCTLDLFSDAEAIAMRGDANRLDDALTNLVINAIKFGAGKPVTVTVEARDSVVRIVVTDRGIGIAEPDRKRIFERFERAVSSENYGGFGLGLWIARRGITAHGGTIAVESVLGQGASFVVELPRA